MLILNRIAKMKESQLKKLFRLIWFSKNKSNVFDEFSVLLSVLVPCCNTVKSLNFVGTKFCGLTMMDMFVDT